MSVKRAQMEIDSAEFTEWIAFHKIRPFSTPAVENLLSIIAAIFANVTRKKGTRPIKPQDFMPKTLLARVEGAAEIQAKVKNIFRIK